MIEKRSVSSENKSGQKQLVKEETDGQTGNATQEM